MAIPISEFFRVTTTIEAGGVTTLDFGRGLLLTTDGRLLSAAGSGKSRYYSDIEAVTADFPATTDAYEAAARWFAQDPYPQGLYIGRWADVNVSTTLRGGEAPVLDRLQESNSQFAIDGASPRAAVNLSSATTLAAVASEIQDAITTGGLSGSLDSGGPVNITTGGSAYTDSTVLGITAPAGEGGTPASVTFTQSSGAITTVTVSGGSGYLGTEVLEITKTSGAGTGATFTPVIAVGLFQETALTPALVGSTFTYDTATARFLLSLSGDDQLNQPYFSPGAGGGTPIDEALGMAQSQNPLYQRGKDAEAPADAVAEITNTVSDRPIYLMLDAGVPLTYGTDEDTIENMWTHAEAGEYIFGFSDTSETAREAGETTSLLTRAFDEQLGNTLPCVADEDRQSHVGALAALSAINWDQPASIITLFGRSLPGTAATRVTETELGNIQAKRGNVYTEVGGLPTFIEGTMSRAGYWADAVAFNLWLKNELESAIWNVARASRRLTVAILHATLDDSMRKAVRNGGVQPGLEVSNTTKADIIATTGNREFDGVLQAGYLIWIGPLAAQSQADISNRRAPPIKIWAKGSEAIHRANVDVVLST